MTGEVYLNRGFERRMLKLGKLLGEGAAGKVYALPEMPGAAAKLYHGQAECRGHEAKIAAMIANPPELPPAMHQGKRYPQIAWPQAKLFDRAGKFIGFMMPEIDFGRSASLVNLLQKSSRRIEKLSEYYGYRVLVARNLASVFAELHRAGHHMIDMKPANLRFYPNVSWMAVVDTDGFSIAGRGGRIPADQLSDEYIAPESWKRPAAELGEEQDLFALAVIIFQLLNNGLHPFAGAAGRKGQATDLQARILDGLYPYAMRPVSGVTPSAASLHRMFRRGTRVMFDCAFQPGDRRPSAAEWRDHLDVLMGQLVPCAAMPEHVHFGAGCGFCAHEARQAATRAAARARPRADPVPRKPGVQVPARPPVTRPVRPRAAHPAMPPIPRLVMVPRPYPVRRRRSGGARALATAILIGFAGLATFDMWRPLLAAGGSARAAETEFPLEIPESTPGTEVARFEEPRDYLILPAGGALSVPLRRGPGEDYPVVERLGLHEPVIGRGTGNGESGGDWIWVTRASDGATGFVQLGTLLERPQTAFRSRAAAPAPAPAPTSVPARRIEARYAELLRDASGYDRAWLTEGRALWQEQRRRCGDEPDPARCQQMLDERQVADLEGWRAVSSERSSPADMPGLTAASMR